MCLYKILYYYFFDICYGFYLVSKEYHEITIMEVYMKIQQYFLKFKKHLYCHQHVMKHKHPQNCLST